MDIHRTDEGEETLLSLAGSLDAISAPELRPIIEELSGKKRLCLTVKLSRVLKIDSSGVGALVAIYKRVLGNGGIVRIKGVIGQPLVIFKLLKLDILIAPRL